MTPTDWRTIRGVVLDYTGVMTDAISMPGNTKPGEETASPDPSVDLTADPRERIRMRMSFELRNPDSGGDWNRLERGEISFDEFLRLFGETVQVDMAPFGSVMGQLMSSLAVRPEMVERVRSLRASGVKTALLTNNVREWRSMWEAKLREANAMDLFDVVLDSSEIGMRKPETRVFELAATRLALDPSEILFVDDFSHNLTGAVAVGMHVLQATPDDAHHGVLDELLAAWS